MLSSFSIANFKAFGPAQEIPLRPITLVFGPNSAGKSSIIQSLLLARHVRDTGNADTHQTTLGGATVDLGGFMRFVHRRRAELDVEVSLTFPRSNFPEQFHYFGQFATLTTAYRFGVSKPGTDVRIKTVRILLDNIELLLFSLCEDGSLALERISSGLQSVLATEIEQIRRRLAESFELLGDSLPDDFESGTPEAWTTIISRMRIRSNSLRLENVAPLPRERFDWEVAGGNADLDRPDWDPVGFYYRWMKDDADEQDRYPKHGAEGYALRYDLECLIDAVDATVSEALAGTSYLGPLRWIPPRVIPDGEQFDASWRAGGGEAWQRLRREPELLDRVNRFLQDTLHSQYRLRCRQLAPQPNAETIQLCVKRAMERSAAAATGNSASDSDTARVAEDAPPSVRAKTDASALAAALESELRAQTTGEGLTELSLVDAETGLAVSHRDVGTGISQLLPVLVNAAGGKKQLIAIEQPELHLHPALQAELGDIFTESALGENKNTFLIETHSEHLILRLLRRIRETAANELPPGATPLKPEHIAVLYVKPGPEGSEVIELPVNSDGDFDVPWPNGFFAERSKELF